MTNYIIFAVFLVGTFLPSSSCRRVPFYRTDYTYVENFDAFYKIHCDVSGSSWTSAFFACADEGATLFYPKAEGEWALVKNLVNNMTEDSNVTDIFVGFHDEFKLGEFITVDGHPMPGALASDSSLLPEPLVPINGNCITMNIDTGLFKLDRCWRKLDTPLPFVCKKVEDKSCPTIDRGYKYLKASRKCYKINKKPQLWQEAMKTCFIEGGILAIIENEAQAEEIRNMIEPGVSYFVGVRRISSYYGGYNVVYYTVKGEKFSETYESTDQPTRQLNYGTVVNRNSHLYTDTAMDTDSLPFICEMEVPV